MLTGKQRRQLRALGHHLSAVVQVGADGVTEGVIKAAAQALEDHELIKVKIAGEDRESRMESVESLAKGTESEVAQTLGKTVLLWKKRKKKSKIALVAE
ncbi:MAG: ribosome assembly RNA-binding protein YhbY [Archangium sp.]|nr:ribosome assembly RNA-binding protein YhbY [Archangium sp.]